ncbi:MAG: hypothetical protein HOP12_02045 [Candidatus Eisenbacteria bacterium]|uniref:PepSY domain-containing protein n=1 Tax=Eiseniibacteriota bacterium TaxID=2212470 RepID=A0A849SC33_UNCEI|nr:hypothetical protein [Candidatus Eisenbacteria bacterium]
MPTTRRPVSSRATRPALALLWLALLLAPLALTSQRALARDPAPVEARVGLDLASAAAVSWAADAQLVYVENDEALDPSGAAPRWSYLFHSHSLDRHRAYSVRDGRIVEAENLEMKLEAPPLGAGWMDSGAARHVADDHAGLEFCRSHGGELRSMLLMRGAIEVDAPDETTWMLVYLAPNVPALFVVIDAAAGKVRRTWRG